MIFRKDCLKPLLDECLKKQLDVPLLRFKKISSMKLLSELLQTVDKIQLNLCYNS